MYIEINTAEKIPALAKVFNNKGLLLTGISYAWNQSAGRYLVSLINRDRTEMEKYFKLHPAGFELIPLTVALGEVLIFTRVESDYTDPHKDKTVRYLANYKGVEIHISDSMTHNFYPYVSEKLLLDLQPHESLDAFMLRQKWSTQKAVFLSMVTDICFPDIDDWINGVHGHNLAGVFREEHQEFVKHMLVICREKNCLGEIDDYIQARKLASIALNKILVD